MRNVVLKMHVSLDGFVGTDSGDVSWVFQHLDEDTRAWEVDGLWQAGVHIMGAVTYDDMAAHWPTSTEPYAPPMNEIPKVVFSKTLEHADWTDSRIARGELRDEISRLKQEPGKDILAHGGARFAQALSRDGLIDEYRLVIHPVALGSGLPLFSDPIDLELHGTKAFAKGAVALTYRRVR
jgi:dihydrofolate reductase